MVKKTVNRVELIVYIIGGILVICLILAELNILNERIGLVCRILFLIYVIAEIAFFAKRIRQKKCSHHSN